MQDRSIASRLRLGGSTALMVVGATLAFAQAASAAGQTIAPVVDTPTTTAALQTDVSTANSAPAGTLTIIDLCGCQYAPTAGMTITSNIEITGPPTYQTGSTPATTQDPQINGSNLNTLSVPVPVFTVKTGGNFLLKGVDIIDGGAGQGLAAIDANGGNTEIDNTAIDSSLGTGLEEDAGAYLTVENSDISDGVSDGFEGPGSCADTGAVCSTFINDSILNNSTGGISGAGIGFYNSVLANNFQASGTECSSIVGLQAAGSLSDDTSCPTSVASDSALTGDFNPTGFNGGPTETTQPIAGSSPIGFGVAKYCPTSDQRFFLYTKYSGGKCDAGSYQSNSSHQDTSVAGPACTIASKNESTDPSIASTEVVNAQESAGIGIGPDGVQSATTTNGTVSWPVTITPLKVGSSTVGDMTWFNETDSGLSVATDFPSTAAYAVTAAKPVGDLTNNDTKWSFFATDWLGNTTDCS